MLFFIREIEENMKKVKNIDLENIGSIDDSGRIYNKKDEYIGYVEDVDTPESSFSIDIIIFFAICFLVFIGIVSVPGFFLTMIEDCESFIEGIIIILPIFIISFIHFLKCKEKQFSNIRKNILRKIVVESVIIDTILIIVIYIKEFNIFIAIFASFVIGCLSLFIGFVFCCITWVKNCFLKK